MKGGEGVIRRRICENKERKVPRYEEKVRAEVAVGDNRKSVEFYSAKLKGKLSWLAIHQFRNCPWGAITVIGERNGSSRGKRGDGGEKVRATEKLP